MDSPSLKRKANDDDFLEYSQIEVETLTSTDTAWSQLKSVYASKSDDYQELLNLLNDWNLGDLLNIFLGK